MYIESSTTCNNWDVRLVDGATSGDGRVEICFNSIWTTVDTNNWDYNSAKVVCRAQNYDADCELIFNDINVTFNNQYYRGSCFIQFTIWFWQSPHCVSQLSVCWK